MPGSRRDAFGRHVQPGEDTRAPPAPDRGGLEPGAGAAADEPFRPAEPVGSISVVGFAGFAGAHARLGRRYGPLDPA